MGNWSELEEFVNYIFDELIYKLNDRRVYILNKIAEQKVKHRKIKRSISHIESTMDLLQDQQKEKVTDLENGSICELNRKLSCLEIQANQTTDNYEFFCDMKEFERSLSNLGTIEKSAVQYSNKNEPRYLFDKIQNIHDMNRISVQEGVGMVSASDYLGKQIHIFTLLGKVIHILKHDQIKGPTAIKLISSRELIVSDFITNSLYRIEFDMFKEKKCKIPTTRNNANFITAIDYDIDTDLIYVTSLKSGTIEILNRKTLSLAGKVAQSFIYPKNINITKTEIFVLDCNNPCLHVLSKSTHQPIRSILPQGIGLNFSNPQGFSLDKDGKIIISHFHGTDNSIQVYSPLGQLLHAFPNDGSCIVRPTAVHVTNNYEVIVLLRDSSHQIQMF
ncbi:hypothetical protein LOD99_12275 [Oopsacas minuta]|uniref:Uncharacterized protein n=1 Tax=Oopsacas minuta TaxID=111878 RepID=A0AAV7JEM9_9METZ|nr:hypothetical protein LOD99_12275 [Oopsacas minuta]